MSELPIPNLTVVKLREGYDLAEVKAFATAIYDGAAGLDVPVTPEAVQAHRFTPVRLRRGYDMGEVDNWLDAVMTCLQEGQVTLPDRSAYLATFGSVDAGESQDSADFAAEARDPAPVQGVVEIKSGMGLRVLSVVVVLLVIYLVLRAVG